jgi:hypothetical protein
MHNFLASDSDEVTAHLAYQNWERRGCPLGSPDIDWFAAEESLASCPEHWQEIPLCSVAMGPNKGPFLSVRKLRAFSSTSASGIKA